MKKIFGSLFLAGFPLTFAAADVDIRQEPAVQAVAKALPTVVNISTDTVVRYRDPWSDWFEEFWGHERETHSLGSGVIVDGAGYVITNAHVVARAKKIHVRLANGTQYEGQLLRSDARDDLALLKIRAARALPHIELAGEKDIFLAETVIAVGNPFGLGSTVTKGILSAKNRKLVTGAGAKFDDILQTDAAVNPGNSGGPLIDLNGKLIGITTAIKSPTGSNIGIGFAIPAWRVAAMLTGLWLEAHVHETREGLVVSNVETDRPEARVGLAQGDRIIGVDGMTVSGATELYGHLFEKKEGDSVKLEVLRDGNHKWFEVRLAKVPQLLKPDGAKLAWQKLGLKLTETGGSLVLSEVDQNGPAAQAGIRGGLMLLGCGGQGVRTLDEVGAVLIQTQSGDRVELAVGRVSRQGLFVSQEVTQVHVSVR